MRHSVVVCTVDPVAARRRFWHQLQASKGEARLAVDLQNRSGDERRLEAFILHMTLAWLKLLQAYYDKDGREKDLYLRDRGRRQRTTEGDWWMKSLQTLLGEEYSLNNPVRRNVEFFLGLRHKIEHRHAERPLRPRRLGAAGGQSRPG